MTGSELTAEAFVNERIRAALDQPVDAEILQGIPRAPGPFVVTDDDLTLRLVDPLALIQDAMFRAFTGCPPVEGGDSCSPSPKTC